MQGALLYLDIMPDTFAAIAKKHHLKLIVLFGSQASGKKRPLSDVDVLITPAEPLSYEQEDELRTALSAALKVPEERVDLVSSYRAGGLLLTEALEKGKLLFGDQEIMNVERIRAWRRFQDTEHFRKLRHQFLVSKLGKQQRT